MTLNADDFYDALKLTLQSYTPNTVSEGLDVMTALGAMLINISQSVDSAILEHETDAHRQIVKNAKVEMMRCTNALFVTTAPHNRHILDDLARSLPILLGAKAQSLELLGYEDEGVHLLANSTLCLVTMLSAMPWLAGLAEARQDLSVEDKTKKSLELADKIKDLIANWTREMRHNPENN